MPNRRDEPPCLAVHRTIRLDEATLTQCGYRQELKRGLTYCNIVGCTVSLASCFLFTEAYSLLDIRENEQVGPAAPIWGWVVGSLAMVCTTACLAEICSTYPTAGGLYWATFALAPARLRRFSCWATGWLSLAAHVLTTVVGEMTCVGFLLSVISAFSTKKEDGTGWQATRGQLMGIYAAALAVHAALASTSQKITSAMLSFGAFWSMLGAPAFMATLLLVAPVKQSSSSVFTTWTSQPDDRDPNHITAYQFLWCLVRVDTGTHLCEETLVCDKVPSRAMVLGAVMNGVLGLCMLLTLSYSAQSLTTLYLSNDFGGSIIVQVVCSAFRARFGTAWGALPLLYMPLLAIFLCPISALVTSSRLVYALSRDCALPGAHCLQRLNTHRVPLNATWLVAGLCVPLLALATYSPQARLGLSCLMVITTNLSFIIPLAFRVYRRTSYSRPGHFSLGKWSPYMALASCLWLGLSSAVFCLPPAVHANRLAVPVALIMLAAVLACIGGAWLLPVYGASHVFTGPRPNLSTHQLISQPVETAHAKAPQTRQQHRATMRATTRSANGARAKPSMSGAAASNASIFKLLNSQHTADLMNAGLDSLDSSHHHARTSIAWAADRQSYLVKLGDVERFSTALRFLDTFRGSTSAGMDEAIEVFTAAQWEHIIGSAGGPSRRPGSMYGTAARAPHTPIRRHHSALSQGHSSNSTHSSSAGTRDRPTGTHDGLSNKHGVGLGGIIRRMSTRTSGPIRSKTSDMADLIIDEVDELRFVDTVVSLTDGLAVTKGKDE